MSFGQNIQFLRRMHNGMTQEELAEKMKVSRQTVSKWELDTAYPEMEKLIELCRLFSCTMDQLVREDMNLTSDAYSNIRLEIVPGFRYIRYAVVSAEPEDDAIRHVKDWAAACGEPRPELIGWDFPFVSQEQINVFHMHGYAAAWILPPGLSLPGGGAEAVGQAAQKYAALTIREPFQAPFSRIPNAFKTLLSYMRVNGLQHKMDKAVIDNFEKVYDRDGVAYMDIFIACCD